MKMHKIDNRAALNEIRESAKQTIKNSKCRILICAGTGCLAGGSAQICERMKELVNENPDIEIHFAPEIAHGDGEIINRLLYKQDGQEYQKQEEIPFYKKQTRLVLENCGHIDAEHMEEAISHDGYQALAKALFEMTPEEVINEITESNLRGRGGGGFQAGYKWSQVARQKETIRYVVCNGDEGDPGAFMDRSIMEGDPH